MNAPRSRRGRLALSMVVPAAALTTLPAYAEEGLFLDLTSLAFHYDLVDADAGPNELIGTLALAPGAASHLTLHRLDLGADGVFGGGDDVVLDVAEIGDAGLIAISFEADVIRGAGSNQYSIVGDAAVADLNTTIGNPSMRGAFASDSLGLFGPAFSFTGSLAPSGGWDALLGPAPTEGWYFDGLADDTPAAPDADGQRGRVTVPGGRRFFDEATVGEFHFADFGIKDLDAFFRSDRSAASADVKISIVPEPGSVLLLLLGAAALKRRSA